MREIDRTVALVTGGSRGIGRALSVQLANAGARVYTCARDEEALRETQSRVDGAGAIVARRADVTEPDRVEALVERIRDDAEHLDVLVHNAGILGPRESIEETPLDGWRQTLEVNLDGPFVVTKAALPLMRRADHPLLVNVSSSVGREGRGGWSAYSVSKCGLEGLTDILADELADEGACVVSVNPGGTATEMRARAYPDEDPATLPSASEIAETMALLIRTLGPDQNGRRYNSRDLLEYVDRSSLTDAEPLPHVGGN